LLPQQEDHPLYAEPSGEAPKPTACAQEAGWITRHINGYKRRLQTRRAEEQHESPVDRASRSTARATWLIAVLTLAMAGVGVSQYLILSGQLEEMRATRESGDRAWLVPDTMVIEDGFTNDADMKIKLLVNNTGRSLAESISLYIRPGAIAITPPWNGLPGRTANLLDIAIPGGTKCDWLRSDRKTEQVVYPADIKRAFPVHVTPDHQFPVYTNANNQGWNPSVFDSIVPRIRKGEFVLFVDGCFAYESGKVPHKSGFCFYVIPDERHPSQSWAVERCQNGNYAN